MCTLCERTTVLQKRQVCCMWLSFRRTIVRFLLISHKPQLWSWNRLYHQKADESSFPTIHLPNGNLVKFSHTNGKHFTIGDSIAFPIVKIGNKTPKTSPSPCTTWTPSNTAMPRATARTTPNRNSDGWGTVAHVRRKVPNGYNSSPQIRPQKYPSRGPIFKPHHLPHTWTRPTYDSKRHPDPIRRFSTMHWTDRRTDTRTDRPTDRPRESLMTIARYASNESDAA